MLSRDARGEDRDVLRHQRDAAAQLARIGIARRDAVERDRAGASDRRSAGAGGRSCSCRRPTGRRSRPSRPAARGTTRRRARARPAASDRRSARRRTRPRRAAAAGSAHRMRRRRDLRLDREQFGQPLGRAGGLRELAPDLAQLRRARSPRTPRRARTGRACRASCAPASTSCAPTHSTTTTLANTRKMMIAVSTARARVDCARRLEGALDRARRSATAPAARW